MTKTKATSVRVFLAERATYDDAYKVRKLAFDAGAVAVLIANLDYVEAVFGKTGHRVFYVAAACVPGVARVRRRAPPKP